MLREFQQRSANCGTPWQRSCSRLQAFSRSLLNKQKLRDLQRLETGAKALMRGSTHGLPYVRYVHADSVRSILERLLSRALYDVAPMHDSMPGLPYVAGRVEGRDWSEGSDTWHAWPAICQVSALSASARRPPLTCYGGRVSGNQHAECRNLHGRMHVLPYAQCLHVNSVYATKALTMCYGCNVLDGMSGLPYIRCLHDVRFVQTVSFVLGPHLMCFKCGQK